MGRHVCHGWATRLISVSTLFRMYFFFLLCSLPFHVVFIPKGGKWRNEVNKTGQTSSTSQTKCWLINNIDNIKIVKKYSWRSGVKPLCYVPKSLPPETSHQANPSCHLFTFKIEYQQAHFLLSLKFLMLCWHHRWFLRSLQYLLCRLPPSQMWWTRC